MIVTTFTGEPESVCGYIQGLIGSGNTIDIVQLTKNNSEYLIVYSGSSPGGFSLLLEDGFNLLLEDGFNILLE
jgi:hypothetical protein